MGALQFSAQLILKTIVVEQRIVDVEEKDDIGRDVHGDVTPLAIRPPDGTRPGARRVFREIVATQILGVALELVNKSIRSVEATQHTMLGIAS